MPLPPCPHAQALAKTAEGNRLLANRSGKKDWYRWGPYLSERQWGTVREDYSANGEAWDYLPHEQARSRAYRWGEDGIGGISDDQQRICFALALWNGRDQILKERLFGLSNGEGNHGEDVKECYYYLDATPSHSYLKMLYKYPQQPFPYEELVAESARRDRSALEYELVDSDAFAEDRYFDVFIEYAKANVDDILVKITAHNRGPETAELSLIPQLWFRNTWSWSTESVKPQLHLAGNRVALDHPDLPTYELFFEKDGEPLFTENTTRGNETAPAKDGFHRFLIAGDQDAVNPRQVGTKVGINHEAKIPAGGSYVIRLRLCPKGTSDAFADFDRIHTERREEADAYYAQLQCNITGEEERSVQRQAFAGLIWSKQWYHYDVERWLDGDPTQPTPPAQRGAIRNGDWTHLNNADIVSMPDKWEYPWYAVWDLAFHCLPLAVIDAHFAKEQLKLFTRQWYLHPNGQLPAYEWDFGDTNPPVHAWATWRVFLIDRAQHGGDGDLAFLESVFHKLMLNFTWWVNRKDVEGRSVFQGGFLGLDNIGVFDRSKPLPTGGFLNQADGTSWMAMYSLNLMRIALQLALHNPVYEDIATKFFEHFLHIADAMTNMASEGIGLWDDEDQFYYDELSLPHDDGSFHRIPLKVRSLVGIIPLFAVETIEPETLARLPGFAERLEWLMANKPRLASLVSRWHEPGRGERRLLSLLRGSRMKRLLSRMLDPNEFLSDYGVRSLSRFHAEHPYTFDHEGQRHEVRYIPAESDSWMFGGNSNWRGPIWFPINFLVIESLQKFHHYYGDDFKVECPTGSGNHLTLLEVAEELTRRLSQLFLPGRDGARAIYGQSERLKTDPHFREHVLFYEYFDGDNGRGVGASHQTGWTALIAKLLHPRRPVRKQI